MVTLQFSTTQQPISRLIRWATWSRHSHVDIVLPDGQLLGAVGEGVSIREFDQGELNIERFQVDAPDNIITIAQSQLGKPYDYTGVIGLGIRRRWQDESKWFCSELVAWAFMQAGHPLLRASDAWRITPRDLLLSPLLTKVTQ